MNKPKVTVVSFIGRPFAGKDFQADRLVRRYPGVDSITTGGLLRNEQLLADSGYTPEQIRSISEKRNTGKIVDDSVVENLVHEAILQSAQKGNTLIILSGHPRNTAQLKDMQEWEKEQREKGELDITPVYIAFSIREKEANKRVAQRLAQEGRADDASMDSIRRRHRVYRRNVWPMFGVLELKRLFQKGEKLHMIDAALSKEDVAKQVDGILAPFLPPIEGQVRKER